MQQEDDQQDSPNCVMSIVMDSNSGNENDGNVGVVFLNKQGLLNEYLILENYARGSSQAASQLGLQNMNPQLRAQYTKERD